MMITVAKVDAGELSRGPNGYTLLKDGYTRTIYRGRDGNLTSGNGTVIVEASAAQIDAWDAAYFAAKDAANAPSAAAAAEPAQLTTTYRQPYKRGSFADAMEGDAPILGGKTGHYYSRRQRGY